MRIRRPDEGRAKALSTPVEELDERPLADHQVGSDLDEGNLKVAKVFVAQTFTIPVGGLQHLGRLLCHLDSKVDGFKNSTARRVAHFYDFEL